MDTRDLYKLVRELSDDRDDVINLYDSMDIELSEGFVIETGVVGFTEDGVIVHLDEDAMEFLDFNGVLLESEEVVKESYDDSPVYNAVLNRITRQHLDLLSKFGPAAVMAAIEDLAQVHHDAEEIGSSDVSIWTKQVIQSLEAGDYKHIHEGGYGSNRDIFHIDDFKRKLSTSNDPFEMIYDAISGDYGEEIRDVMQEMYDDVVIDSQGRLHPDDDFEKVIDSMLDYLDADSGMKEGAYSDHQDSKYDDDSTDPSVTARDKERAAGRRRAEDDGWDPKRDEIDEELAAIKRLAGDEEVNEAEYQGRKVPLGKPMQGDVKKSKVYVKKPNGKVVKVNFGDKNMTIKKNNPARRKSFRARHNCDNPGPRWKARYWSCRAW
jgi:hypothetical protein